MVDVWLIFAQAVPWVEVLLHTWIDTSRTEGEGGREINNHGKSITVGGKDDKEIYMSTDNGQSFTPALTPDVPESSLSKNMERVQVFVFVVQCSVDLVCSKYLQILTDDQRQCSRPLPLVSLAILDTSFGISFI